MLEGSFGNAQMAARSMAILAAAILVCMPPDPMALLTPPAIASIRRRDFEHPGNELRVGIVVRVGRVQSVDIRQENQAIGAHHLRDACREAVVVAVADLGRRDRVVFVDHRHRPECQQRIQRAAAFK